MESVCGILLLSLRACPGKELAGLCEQLLAALPEVLAINFISAKFCSAFVVSQRSLQCKVFLLKHVKGILFCGSEY